jgi:phytoene desaturase
VRLADDFSLYLHAPKRTDGDYYPAGKDGFYVLSPVPNNHSGVNWQQEGERYAEKILAHLEQRLMPGLRARLETAFFVTPDYFEQELWSLQGAAFGIEPLFQQSAYFRYHNRSEDVDGLYFVGANTHPGAGVPGVLNSAKLLDHLIAAPRQPAPVPV